MNYTLCLSNEMTNLIMERGSPMPGMLYSAFPPLDVLATAFFSSFKNYTEWITGEC